ncbi:MAG: DUF4159 domain-containing protein [Deltaproteobacteria bacterium]|nr:DUF4159 domain-containing protein [Deltaproteobacteria bacterium]
MSFLSILFLWASLSAVVPVVIALWNRKRHRTEKFGGYFLLKQITETTQRRIRLFEILKLLNRICLFILLVLIFAEPFKKVKIFSQAEEGFALLLDTGRVMQASAENGRSLVSYQEEKVRELLQKFPKQAQGSIFFVSDRCGAMKLEGQKLTGTASDWLSAFRPDLVSYSNAETKSEALIQCLGRIEMLFGQKKIYMAFISPLPDTLDEVQLKKSSFQIESLPTPLQVNVQNVKVLEEQKGSRVRLHIDPPASRQATLIQEAGSEKVRLENLGSVQEIVDLPASGKTWLWLQSNNDRDPWVSSRLVSIEQQQSYQITLWSMKESPGFQSLLAALRNYPDLKVIRQIGGKPSGNPIIIYGDNPFPIEDLEQAWFFINPEAATPFPTRDKKQWSSGSQTADVQRSFQISTQDGKIFIRKYQILDLDRFETLETFEDGAPSLLRDRQGSSRRWISPFDLEDLTTDVALEPTFIPYLYRRLEKWLAPQASTNSSHLHPLWLMPGRTQPTSEVLVRQAWPGIYMDDVETKVIEASALPQKFLKVSSAQIQETTQEEKVSRRATLIRWLVVSLFLELLFCLMSARTLVFFSLIFAASFFFPTQSSVFAAPTMRPIKLAVFQGMDADRKLALTQFEFDAERMSNLDFEKPIDVKMDQLWENSVIVFSSTREFGPLRKEDREKIRDYCERGGLLFFDDPLATTDSAFYKSVKKEMSEIFPSRPFKPVSKEDVLFRTFYLLSEVSGRKLASPYLEGVELDKRWVAIFSFNDILGANLKTAKGDFAYSVSPYGISQRVLAKRLLLNILMYSVALDYKDDAIHLPHILKRRSR